jgi:hypothetical protein
MKAALLILFVALSTPVLAQERIAIELLIDDSGVLLDADAAQSHKLLLLSHVKALATKRAGASAKVEVISTSYGRTVWSGTPLAIRRDPARAQELVDAIASDPGRCNNLPGAFAELRSNLAQLEREGVNAVHIIVFSSLVHTPRPCADLKTITLPQLPPAEGDIAGALGSSPNVRSVYFYWVSPHQRIVWEQFLTPSFTALRNAGARVSFFDVERSKSALYTSPFAEAAP